MATVFLAQDLRDPRRVAIKVLAPELAAVLGPERFRREIEIAAGLGHPHILALYESGADGDPLYYRMPYAEGESLRHRLEREKQLPVADAVRIAGEVANALDYAHRKGVVHRDIKPENILLLDQHAVVADFGIARAVMAAGGEKLTQTGVAIGTSGYMSPEQTLGSRDLDGRSDQYSLGCVLYEMLAGHPPFTGATAESVAHQHLNLAPRPVTDLRPAVSHNVARAIQRTLSKAAADRFRSAAEFAQVIAEAPAAAAGAAEPVHAAAGGARTQDSRGIANTVAARPGSAESPKTTTAAPTRTPATGGAAPRRLGRLALLGGVVVLAGVGLWMLRPNRPKPPPRERLAVAVLPLQDLSVDGPNAYFAGGLHDELLTQLSKLGALKVISRTSVMGYQGTTKPLKVIARELGVGRVVEGSVQVVGGRLRVNVQLIDAATDEHLWAERYDRTLDDAFAIQSEVAQQIARAVGAALSTAEQGRLATPPTANAEAYRLYLQGLDYYARPGNLRDDRQAARQLYERALALDPNFADAHAALSVVHGQVYFAGRAPSDSARQREEAEAALRLAPNLPQAHFAMGRYHYQGRRDYRRALEEYAIALQGLPNDAELWRSIGAAHRRLGNWNEAIPAFEKCTQLNPRDANLYLTGTGPVYALMHRYADAARAYEQALSLAPDLHEAAVQRGWTYVDWQGQLDTLRVVLSRVPLTSDLTFSGGVAVQRAELHLWERDAGSLLQMPQPAGGDAFSGEGFFQPEWLYVAWAHQLRGDHAATRAAFDSALVQVHAALERSPDDWRVHVARGLALAGLGRRAEALEEARWLQQSDLYREDHCDGPWLAIGRARILAQLGDADAALDEIARLLAEPSWLSVHDLRLHPIWDPIRKHPQFKALLAKYS